MKTQPTSQNVMETTQKPKTKTSVLLKTVLRILIGAFFITTAILKLLSLDNFEIYIYSFDLFGFVFSTIVARLVIAAELLLGILLIVKIYYKPTWWLTMAMLTGFTLLLVYTAIFRHDANCHCMGDFVQLNPTWSILKNLVTMILLFIVRKEDDYRFKGKVAVGIIAVVVAFAVPFVAFPMDTLYNKFVSDDSQINQPKFDQFMQDSTVTPLHLQQGKYVLGFLAAGCKYCQISGTKLNTIMENNHLDSSKVVFFIWGNEAAIEQYKQKTGAVHYRYLLVSPYNILNIMYGKFPTYILLDNGKIVDVLDLRHLDEKTINNFLKDSQ